MPTCPCCGQLIPESKIKKTSCINLCRENPRDVVAVLYGRDNFVWKQIPTNDEIRKSQCTVKEILGYLPKDRHGFLNEGRLGYIGDTRGPILL
jgi:hypothetical protein